MHNALYDGDAFNSLFLSIIRGKRLSSGNTAVAVAARDAVVAELITPHHKNKPRKFVYNGDVGDLCTFLWAIVAEMNRHSKCHFFSIDVFSRFS